MGDLIRNDNEDGIDAVKVGESGLPVPIKIYQDIYHQITGRTEQIRKRYSDNLLIEYSDIEQLHFKIQQLCDVYKIVASNAVVSVFHEKERKEQFTSFERFRLYNSNTASPTVSFLIKYNFSLIPAGMERPQEYVVTIRLTSRVAMLRQLEEEAPPFIRNHLVSFVALNTAEIVVDYVDYVVARGFLEAFEEWVRGCKKTPSMPFLSFLRKWSGYIPGAAKLLVGGAIACFAFLAVPDYFGGGYKPEVWARFFIVYAGGALVIVPLMGAFGSLIEESIDNFPMLSYLNLNKGDANLVSDFSIRRRSVILKFLLGAVSSVVLGIVSAKLEKFL